MCLSRTCLGKRRPFSHRQWWRKDVCVPHLQQQHAMAQPATAFRTGCCSAPNRALGTIPLLRLHKTPLFFEFSYVCPEPVWVKCSFLYINGAKSGVFRIVHTIAKQLLLLCLLLLLLLALQLLAEACVLCQCILRGLPTCQKRLIPQLSLCLSRACLGKLNIENGSKRHLPYRGRLRSTRSSSCCRIRWLDSRGASDLPRSIRT